MDSGARHRPVQRRAARAAALLLCPALAAAQGFPAPVNVSQSANGSYLPSLVVDRGGPDAGTLRLFWHDFTSAPNLAWCSDGSAAGFAPGAPCPFNVTQSWTPRAASDASGITHVAWRDRTAGQDDILHATFDGVSWSVPENVSVSAAASRNPVIALDPQGRPHVLWEEDSPLGVRYFESDFDGAAWSAPSDTGLAFSIADTLRIACDGAGALHAVWPDGATSLTEVLHAERPAGGAWSMPENVSSTPGSYSAEPSIAVDAAGGLHVAWVEQDATTGMFAEIDLASRPAGGAWSARQELTSLGLDAWRPAIAVGADGVPRVAFASGPTNDREVLLIAAPGAAPVSVSVSPGVDSDRAALLLDGADAPWVAWQEGSVPTPEIFVAGPGGAPPSPPLLVVAKGGPDALLTWTGGQAPFVVTRASTPDAPAPWPELTPPGGIAPSAWADAGVIGDGVPLWCWLVE